MDRFSRMQQIVLGFWAASTLSFMAMMSIGGSLGGVLGIWVCWRERERWQEIRQSFYWVPTLFLVGVASLSLLVAYFDPPLGIPIQGFNEIKKFRYFLLPIFGAALILSTNAVEGKPLEQSFLWKVLLGMTLLMSLIAAFQFWAGYLFGESFILDWKVLVDGTREYQPKRFFRLVAGTLHSHAQGLMFFHLSFATAISFSINYLLARVLWPMQEDGKKLQIFLLISTLIAAAALYFTYSRTAWITLVVIPVVLCFLRKPKWGLVVLGMGPILVAILWLSSSSVRQRVHDSAGWTGRYYVWASSLEMVKDRPIWGVGFGKSGAYTDHYAEQFLGGTKSFSSHAHNNMLDALATTGALGFLAYLFWFGLFGYYAWQLFRRAPPDRRWLPAALLGAWVAFQINGLTQVNFYDGKSQHSLMFWASLLIALWLREAKSSTQEYDVKPGIR